MNTQHTPGPWRVSFNTIRQGPVVIADCAPLKEVEANARLIAAAPELLEALRVAEQFINLKEDSALAVIRTAIAKATQP